MEMFEIKPLDQSHWPEVKRIYLEGIETKLATFETSVPDWELWDSNHLPYCRYVTVKGDVIAGWAALLPVSKRKVYQGVAEVSIYISAEFRGQGAGKVLMTRLVNEAEKQGIWTLQCSLFPENKASCALHKSLGFREIGYREKIAKLDNVWRNTILMERRSSSPEFSK